MIRRQDWPARLHACIEQRRCMPFAWGVQDCCQFARRAFEAVTGADPAAAWGLRSYRSERTAAALLRRLGGIEALPAKAGCSEVPVLLASRGDVALVPNEGRPALGVVLGAKVAFPGAGGLHFVATAQSFKTWRVG